MATCDFSLVDQIYHPDYSAPDPEGIVVNLEDASVRETYMIGFLDQSLKVMSLSVSIDSLDQEKRMSIIHYQCDHLQRWKNIEAGNSI